MTNIGCDLSGVDDNGTIPGWQQAQVQGHLSFVGLRCARGVTPDTKYATYRAQLDQLGIPNFPYLILAPGVSSPEAQAEAALKVVGTLNQRYFPLSLDVEGDRHGLTAVEWLDWVTRAKRTIKAAIGVAPMLYTSRTYWMDPVGMNDLPAPELVECLGWWKYYPYAVHTPAIYDPAVVDQMPAPPCPPPWGSAWGIEQFMGDAPDYPGFKAWVDMDRLHVVKKGDINDTVKWIQKRLPGINADGDFGSLTEAAVQTFQTQMGIVANGVVELATFQCLAWVKITP